MDRLEAWCLGDVARRISTAHGVPLVSLLGRGRTANVARARNALYAALRDEGLSYPEIERMIGRDHCTIMSGVRRWLVWTDGGISPW